MVQILKFKIHNTRSGNSGYFPRLLVHCCSFCSIYKSNKSFLLTIQDFMEKPGVKILNCTSNEIKKILFCSIKPLHGLCCALNLYMFTYTHQERIFPTPKEKKSTDAFTLPMKLKSYRFAKKKVKYENLFVPVETWLLPFGLGGFGTSRGQCYLVERDCAAVFPSSCTVSTVNTSSSSFH